MPEWVLMGKLVLSTKMSYLLCRESKSKKVLLSSNKQRGEGLPIWGLVRVSRLVAVV